MAGVATRGREWSSRARARCVADGDGAPYGSEAARPVVLVAAVGYAACLERALCRANSSHSCLSRRLQWLALGTPTTSTGS